MVTRISGSRLKTKEKDVTLGKAMTSLGIDICRAMDHFRSLKLSAPATSAVGVLLPGWHCHVWTPPVLQGEN